MQHHFFNIRPRDYSNSLGLRHPMHSTTNDNNNIMAVRKPCFPFWVFTESLILNENVGA
jgi:hypothetical protein